MRRGHQSLLLKLQVAVAFCLLLAMCSCAGNSSPRLKAADSPAAPKLHGAPLLPAPQALSAQLAPRSAAFSPEALVRQGADYDEDLPHNRSSRSDGSAVLSPNYTPGGPLSGLAYATWLVNVDDYAGQPRLRISFDTAPLQEADFHILLANFDSQRWDHFAYIPGNFIDFGALPPYVDGNGRLLAVLLMSGTQQVSISRLRLGDPVVSGSLLADPPGGFADLEVNFDASQLSVNGALVESYEWDLDGDGDFELDTDAFPEAQSSFSAIGDHLVSVRLRSSDGLSSVASTTVRVLQNVWDKTTIGTATADDGSGAFWPLIAVADGRPVVTWLQYEVWNEDLQLGDVNTLQVRVADDAAATSWGPKTQVVDHLAYANRLAGFTQIDDDFLGLCYIDGGVPYNVYFVRDDDGSGANWQEPVLVSSGVAHHEGASMDLVAGEPIILFTVEDPEGDRVRGAHPAAPDCLSWDLDINCSPNSPTGPLVVCDALGTPAAFGPTGNSTSFHARAVNPEGTNWIMDTTSHQEGEHYSAGTIGSKMVVGYQHSSDEPTLLYTEDFTGSTGFNLSSFFTMECDSTALAGPSLGFEGAFCFHETISDVLVFCFLSDTPGGFLEFDDPVTVDDGGPVGHGCNMTICNGVPMIVYEDWTDFSIKLAVLR